MLGVITFLNPLIVQRVRYSDFHFRDEENEAVRGKASFFFILIFFKIFIGVSLIYNIVLVSPVYIAW